MPIQSETPSVWTPPVWQEGPDGLIADAKQELWIDYQDLDTVLATGAGGSGGGDAMAGTGTAPQNETDQIISAQPDPVTSVVGEWDKAMDAMAQKTEGIDSWESDTGRPPMNPAP